MEKQRLLIVEDHPDMREVLCEVFRNEYDVSAPASEQEIMPLFTRANPRFVILDYILWNGCRGDQVLKLMKAANPQVNVIMHTCCDERAIKERLLMAGAYRFVEKASNSIAKLKTVLKEIA